MDFVLLISVAFHTIQKRHHDIKYSLNDLVTRQRISVNIPQKQHEAALRAVAGCIGGTCTTVQWGRSFGGKTAVGE